MFLFDHVDRRSMLLFTEWMSFYFTPFPSLVKGQTVLFESHYYIHHVLLACPVPLPHHAHGHCIWSHSDKASCQCLSMEH